MSRLTRREVVDMILTALVFALFFGMAAMAPGGLPGGAQ